MKKLKISAEMHNARNFSYHKCAQYKPYGYHTLTRLYIRNISVVLREKIKDKFFIEYLKR